VSLAEVDRPGTAGLLGRKVRGRAQHLAGHGQRALLLDEAGQPKVANLGFAGRIEKDVRRLEVAVQHALLMRVVHGRANLATSCAASCAENATRRVQSASDPPGTNSMLR
jgi:hypothetical protein